MWWSRFILKIFGWKLIEGFPKEKKMVVLVAPHTSLLDFVLGWLYFSSMGLKSSYLIKGSYFFFPLGPILRALGGIPVGRGENTNLVVASVNEFKKKESLLIAITPEATRSATANWKKGFYHIAKRAGVPIFLGGLDYESKSIIVGPLIIPSGNVDEEMITIKRFYQNIKGRHPERFKTGLENEEE